MAQLSVREIAARLDTVWSGDPQAVVSGVATLADAGPSDLSFYADPRYRQAFITTRAGVVLVRSDDPSLSSAPSDRILPVSDPHRALWQVLLWMFPEPTPAPGIHSHVEIAPSARVDPTARIDAMVSVGAGAEIGPRVHLGVGVYVGENVSIGEESRIGPNAVLLDGVMIGARVRIGPGSVVGSIGFGYVQVGGESHRVPHVGTVIIEDDVEIGANCTIDRATLGATRIGRGSKLDNLVHVGHNVVIGAHVLIAAQCGLSGSATLGDGVLMGGQAGVAGHIVVAPNMRIAAKAGVMKSIPDRRSAESDAIERGGTITYAGHPARPLMEQRRAEAALFHLGDLRRRVDRLERLLSQIRGSARNESNSE